MSKYFVAIFAALAFAVVAFAPPAPATAKDAAPCKRKAFKTKLVKKACAEGYTNRGICRFDPVARLVTTVREPHRSRHDTTRGVQLAIGNFPVPSGIVSFPNNRNLITAGLQMPVQAIV